MMINILLFIIAAMTLVIGLVLLLSNRHTKERMSAISFGVAVIGVGLWVLFVALFRTASSEGLADIYLKIFTLSALLLTVGVFVYSVTFLKSRTLKVVLSLICIMAVTITGALILRNPDSFFAQIVYLPDNNIIETLPSSLFLMYGLVIGVFLTIGIILILLEARKNNNNKNRKNGLIFVAVGISVAAVMCGIFDIVLLVLGYFELFWVGPLSVSIAMLFIYFATLKYRLFTNSSKVLKYSTYFVAIAMTAALYVCLFYLLFMLVFKGATPSDEMIIFQFVMIVIIMLFLPTISHVYNNIMKLIMDNKAHRQGQ